MIRLSVTTIVVAVLSLICILSPQSYSAVTHTKAHTKQIAEIAEHEQGSSGLEDLISVDTSSVVAMYNHLKPNVDMSNSSKTNFGPRALTLNNDPHAETLEELDVLSTRAYRIFVGGFDAFELFVWNEELRINSEKSKFIQNKSFELNGKVLLVPKGMSRTVHTANRRGVSNVVFKTLVDKCEEYQSGSVRRSLVSEGSELKAYLAASRDYLHEQLKHRASGAEEEEEDKSTKNNVGVSFGLRHNLGRLRAKARGLHRGNKHVLIDPTAPFNREVALQPHAPSRTSFLYRRYFKSAYGKMGNGGTSGEFPLNIDELVDNITSITPFQQALANGPFHMRCVSVPLDTPGECLAHLKTVMGRPADDEVR